MSRRELERPGGVRIAYEVRGEGPALVLVHGGFVSRASWARELDVFAASHQLIAIDLRGHGESSRARDYSVSRMAEDVGAVCEAEGVEQAVVWGHSLGGMVCMELARRRRELVRGMVLMDTSYSTRATTWEMAQTALAKGVFSLFSVSQVAKWTSRELGARRMDAGEYVRREMMTHADDRAHYKRMWDAVFAFDASLWVSRLDVPTLVMVGALNRATHRQGRQMARWIRGATLVEVPGAGHMVNWDNPDASDASVRAFLSRLAPSE